MDSQADSHSIVSSQNRAQQVQIPSKNWMEPYLPIAAVLLLALILRSWTLFCGTNVDEGDYLMQGREWMRGHLPYLDVHLNKPPLVSILSFPFFLFSSVPIVPVRIFMILFSISSIFAIWLLGRELRDEKTGLFAACWLAFDPYSAIWAKALHVSTLAPELSIWALALFTIGRRRNQALYMTLAGLFSALCILNKQTGVTILPILALAGFFYGEKKSIARNLMWFLAGFLPPLILLLIVIVSIGAMEPFFYDLIGANTAMAGFFHYTLLDRWMEFRMIAHFNPLVWFLALFGVMAILSKRFRLLWIPAVWLVLEFGVNLFALSHVWPHYMLVITAPACILAGGFCAWLMEKIPVRMSILLHPAIPIVLILLCTAPFWPRSNWQYPNITLKDERGFAAFIQRRCPSEYLLCFVNSAFYIWTDKEVPPSIRGNRQVRIPPFMNTAGRKYLTLEDMKKTTAYWETLPIDLCVMYGKYYHQIFEDQDPHLQPVREFLERHFKAPELIATKETYYARMIYFQRKTEE